MVTIGSCLLWASLADDRCFGLLGQLDSFSSLQMLSSILFLGVSVTSSLADTLEELQIRVEMFDHFCLTGGPLCSSSDILIYLKTITYEVEGAVLEEQVVAGKSVSIGQPTGRNIGWVAYLISFRLYFVLFFLFIISC